MDLSHPRRPFGSASFHPLGTALQVLPTTKFFSTFFCWKHLIPLFFQPAVRLLRVDHPPSDEDRRNASRHLPTLLGRSPQRDPRPGLQMIIIAITLNIIITITITTININIIIIRSAMLLVASSRQRPGSSSPPDEQFCTFWERFPEKISIQNPETDNKCEYCPPLNVDQVAE